MHALFSENKQSIGSENNITGKLSDFHTYILEWNESTFVWKFDQDTLKIVNLTKELDGYVNPFNKSFSLMIT